MKTKHFFYSMALIAALGACSSENLEVTNTDVQDLSIRPLVGDVELTVGDAQTRFATGTGAQPVFGEGDKLGACIIDVPTYVGGNYKPSTPAVEQYNIVEYYSSNNAFTYDGGIWKVDQPLVEGNYLFYAPYNQKMQARTPLRIKVPVKQTATSEKAALDEFYKSGAVVRVGYQFLAANDGVAQKPKVTMNDVFAYPLFTIKNNFKGLLDGRAVNSGTITAFNGGTIKLDSIQFSQRVKTNNNNVTVTCGGVLKHAQGNVAATAANAGVVGKMKPEGAWAVSPMATYTEDLLSTTVVDNNVASDANRDRTGGVITTLVCNKEIAAGGEYKVYGVLPAQVYTNATNQMQVTLFVTIGEKHYKIENAKVVVSGTTTKTYTLSDQKGGVFPASTSGTITLIKGQKYPQEELNFINGKLSAKDNAGSILTIDLKGGFGATSGATAQIATEFDASAPVPVTEIKNNAELIDFFDGLENGTALTEGVATAPATGTFKLADDNTVEINSTLIDALFSYNNKGKLKINTALPIAKDVKITNIAAKDVTFKSAAGKEFVISLGTDYEVATTSANVTTGTTKTVIINGACTTFTNAGTIKTLYVVAGNSLTINAEAAVQGNVINDGTVTVSNDFTPGSLVNSNGATLEVKAKIVNTVENNGTMTIVGNDAEVVVNAGTGTIKMASTVTAGSKVFVTGGVQEGIYGLAALDKTNIEAGEKLAWVNAVETTAAEFSAEVLAAMVDIKKVYATGATFGVGEFDMVGKTLVLIGTAAKTISGNGLTTTTVKNFTIVNAGNSNVTLSTINASGTFTNAADVTGKILADGTDAKWNGNKAE